MDIKRPKISVLIPDGEDNMLLNVVFSLSLVRNIKIYVLSTNRNHYMRYSSLIKKFVFSDDLVEKDWVEKIDFLVDEYDIDIILPVFETGTRKLIIYKNYFLNKERLCSLPNIDSFNKARNKYNLYLHLVSHKLPCPVSCISKQGMTIESLEFDFPIIAKPVAGYFAGRGVKLFTSLRDTNKYLITNNYGCDILLQEYIEGYDISVNVICKNGAVLAHTMQKRHLSSTSKSYQLEFSFVNDIVLLGIIKELMESLKWSGVANIDCRFDINDNKYKIIEINPRYWVNTEASALAGVNFPYLHCLSSLYFEIDAPRVNEIPFLSLKGLVKRLKKNPFLLFKFGFLWRNTPLRFVIRDPLTIIFKFIWRTKVILARKKF